MRQIANRVRWTLSTGVVALLFLATSAQAETVTLVCTARNFTETIDIDFDKSTACIYPDLGGTTCVTEPAEITENFIEINGNVRIDRRTGEVVWANLTKGICRPAKQKF